MNLVIGVAVLCCLSCCSSSLTNSGLGGSGGLLGGLLGLPGSVLTAGLGLDADAPGFEGGFTKGATDPVGGIGALADMAQGKPTEGNTITQVSTDQECGLKCGDCTGASWDYLEERYGKERSDEAKTWCQATGLIDGQSSKTKFGKPCCIPPLTMAEQEEKGLVVRKVKGGQLQQARALCDSGDERACAALRHAGVEGYTIRKRVI